MSVNSHSGPHAEIRKRPVQGRSRRTVEAILDSAAHFFAAEGYAATTTNHVAERAGVSIGSLYQYFPNKDSLLVALEERHLDSAGQVFRAKCALWRRTEPGPAEWAPSLVEMLIEVNDSELHRVVYNTAPRSPSVEGQASRVVDELVDEVEFHLRRWGRTEDVRLRARIAIVALLAVVHEIVIQTPAGRHRARTTRHATEIALCLTRESV